MFRRTSRKKKRDTREVRSVVAKKSRSVDREGRRRLRACWSSTRLLDIDEEVALQDVLPFLVLLGLFVRLVLRTKGRGS